MTERNQLAYICAPFRGDVKQNIERAKEYARYVYELGLIPVTPHVMFPFLDDDNPKERDSAMQMDLELLSKCEYMYIFGSMTEGMQKEFEFAQDNDIVFYHIVEEVFEKRYDNKYIEWLRKQSEAYVETAANLPGGFSVTEDLVKDAEMLKKIADRLERLG